MADPGASFQQGKTLGDGASSATFSGIGSGAVTDKIPAFGSSPTEAQLFQGGQGQLIGPGIGKMQNCGSYTPSSDKIANQECEAVNFLARNPQIRPQFNITKNDPMVIGAKTARNNAESFFQSTGIDGGAGNSSQCTTKTETTPPQYSIETCSSASEIGMQQCTMGRTINIDSDANFQCERTVTALSNAARSTTVTTPQCTTGRTVNIDSDSNFQCSETVNAYETTPCRKIKTITVSQNCVQKWVTYSWSPPSGPWGNAISTFGDFQSGSQRVCDYLLPGSTAVSATCRTQAEATRLIYAFTGQCFPQYEGGYMCIPANGEGGVSYYPVCVYKSTNPINDAITYDCFNQAPVRCDSRQNEVWSTGGCSDQGWCSGYGIGHLSCKRQETSCTPTASISTTNHCATLESRTQ